MEPFIVDTNNGSNFDRPQSCPKCGYHLSETLTKIPHQDIPSEFTRSNYAPSLSDRSAIRDLVASSEVSIQILKAELSTVQAAATALRLRLLNIRTSLKDFQHSLLSPIRKLPDEILAEIFKYHVCQNHVNVGVQHGPVWDLMQICILWRDIAKSTPSLWNRFEVVHEMEIVEAAFALRIQSCLEFSGTLPLSIYILPTRKINISIPLSILEDIAQHADRLVYFKIDGSIFKLRSGSQGSKAEKMFAQLIKQRGTPRLHELAMYNCHEPFFGEDVTALEEVAIGGDSIPQLSRFPWIKVKRLITSKCFIVSESQRGILTSALGAMSESLEELTWFKNIVIDLTQVVTLLSLHTITVQDTNWMDYDERPGVWYKLRVPHLTNLRFIDVDPFVNIRPILSMIRTSACTIKRLELNLTMASSFKGDGSFIASFRSLCDIEELSLIWAKKLKYRKSVILDLIWDASASESRVNLFPSLQTLELVYPTSNSPVAESFALVENVMRSRSPAASNSTIEGQILSAAPLSLIRYKVDSRCCPDFSWLKDLGEELGIKIDAQFTNR